LVFSVKDRAYVEGFIADLGGEQELPFIREEELRDLVCRSIIAVECENSLWVCERMPDFGKELKPQKWLNGKPGMSKSAVLPTVIVKEEDRHPLLKWQENNRKPIHVWHVFYDRGYGLALDEAERLVNSGLILPTEQTFQAPGGAVTQKKIIQVLLSLRLSFGGIFVRSQFTSRLCSR
jgi:post-segregation antitoxin (ccd killing protein)